MDFNLNKLTKILQNTPQVLTNLICNLPEEWTEINEGGETWTIKEVLAHLIFCEETNWLTRVKIILSTNKTKTFVLVDMKAHFEIARNHSAAELLDRFKKLRKRGIKKLESYQINNEDLLKTAYHPVLETITLQQLISTWVIHDLTHIVQISRILAKQNKANVGKFEKYLTLLNK